MNTVSLVGGLTKDVVLKIAPSGVKYIQFALAVDSSQKTNYIELVCFDKQTEALAQNGKKGTKLSVEGHLTQSQYMDHEGNKHNTQKVVVEKFTVVSNYIMTPQDEEGSVVEV